MKFELDRRSLIKFILSSAIVTYFQNAFGSSSPDLAISNEVLAPFVKANAMENPGNFHAIFSNLSTKEDFFLFLQNVYNIYPEKEFHDLIARLVQQNKTDQEIYLAILANLNSIKPFLSELTYALPALAKQKSEIAEQTLELLSTKNKIQGYLEIGTPGRYVSALKEKIEIVGDLALVNVTEPSFSPIDIAERGRLMKVGRYIPLKDYLPISTNEAADQSFEVVTNYIGFHHSELDRLDAFVRSINRVLKPNGHLILRDHDVVDEKMNHMVALAHDVFNAGLKTQWTENHKEIRNFRSLENWISYLKDRGFKYSGRQIYQKGDPTKNALMHFTKV